MGYKYYMIEWPMLKFPGMNLWNAPLSPEMQKLHKELRLEMNIFREPTLDRTSNRWYVEEIDPHTNRRIHCYDFYDESDARQFYYENTIKIEVMGKGYV